MPVNRPGEIALGPLRLSGHHADPTAAAAAPAACRLQPGRRMAQAPDLSQKPANLHQRITSPDDEEVDPLLEQTGCVAPYTALEVAEGAGHAGGGGREDSSHPAPSWQGQVACFWCCLTVGVPTAATQECLGDNDRDWTKCQKGVQRGGAAGFGPDCAGVCMQGGLVGSPWPLWNAHAAAASACTAAHTCLPSRRGEGAERVPPEADAAARRAA